MADHVQQQILVALKATLIAAATAAGGRVYVDHPDELVASMLPAIVITPGDEDIDNQALGLPYLQMRSLELEVIAVCTGSGAAAAARDLGRAIEAALYATESAATVGGLARPLELMRVAPRLNGQGADIVAEVRQAWRVMYATETGAPDVAKPV